MNTITAIAEIRIPAPELRGANYALGACRDLEVCLDGPAGCVAGETRIFNPVTGEHTPIKELCEKGIAPIVQTLIGAIQAEVPFCKGVRKLYCVTLASGRQCVTTDNHLFLTPDGWRFLSACAPGSQFLISSPCPLPTTEESGPLVSQLDAFRLSQIPLGSQERYSVYSRPDDVLPPWKADSAQVVALLQADVLSRSHDGPCEGDLVFSPEYTRQHPQFARPARTCCSPSSDDTVYTQSHAQPETFSQVGASSRYVVPFLRERLPLSPIVQSLLDGDNTRLHALSSMRYHFYPVNRLRGAWAGPIPERSKRCSSSVGTTQELPASLPESRACSLSNSTSNSKTSVSKFDYTIQWDTVSSIEYLRTDEYFDLHVPIAEHYLAEGVWHHNTGKTFAALYKVHLLLLQHPGAKALVARKTNTALAGSALATYREQILDPNEGVTYFGGNKVRPAAFEYPNGSVMVVQGLDKREKIRSWEFDIAYINEATECDEEDIEFVRMRLRNGKMGYHQLIMDCNPDAPEHWLNQRMESGKTTRLLSRHEDNPRYYDIRTGRWTEAGQEYIFVTLAGLTGVLRDRYFGGVWTAAIGAIYSKAFDRARNVIPLAKLFPVPREWPRYLAVDFGYSHPFVCKWYAVDPDGRLYCYREIYQTQTLVEDLAKQVLIASGWFHLLPTTHSQHKDRPAEWADPLPREVICDHDAEDRATFEKHTRLTTTPAKKAVKIGIQAVAARLRPAGDDKPRLLYFENMLVSRDERLVKQKKPVSTLGEFGVYVWSKGADGSQQEEPVKEHDHGLDCDRYMVAHFDLGPGSVSYYHSIWGS